MATDQARHMAGWLALAVGPVYALIVPPRHPVRAVAVVERGQYQGAHPCAPEARPLSLITASESSRFPSMPTTTAPIISMLSGSRLL